MLTRSLRGAAVGQISRSRASSMAAAQAALPSVWELDLPALRPAARRADLPDPKLGPVVHNFSSGPGPLPAAVMERAQSELLSWPEAPGMSVMSVSHRESGGPYQQLMVRVEQQVRDALDVPANYAVLFMQGGAHAQFSAVPLNLASPAADGGLRSTSHIDTGFWARRAATEHAKYSRVAWAASADPAEQTGRSGGGACKRARPWQESGSPHVSLPPVHEWAYSHDDAYVHLCANETISGLELLIDPSLPPLPPLPSHLAAPSGRRLSVPGAPPPAPPPLVADFTSTLLSRPVDVSKYGVVYCSGGKNLGPAGVTLVLVRDDLLGSPHPLCPSAMSYSAMASTSPIPNLYLTPPTFSLYMVGLVLEHLREAGGVATAERRAALRSGWLYEVIDSSRGFYQNSIEPSSRSRMSVPFTLAPGARSPEELAALEQTFLAEAEAAGFTHLRGHPLAGGLRASLYNGVSDESVAALVSFLLSFQARHG